MSRMPKARREPEREFPATKPLRELLLDLFGPVLIGRLVATLYELLSAILWGTLVKLQHISFGASHNTGIEAWLGRVHRSEM
jgi:Na+-driven multidrug efflux pump